MNAIMYAKINDLLGKTLTEVIKRDDVELIFKCDDATTYIMYHAQDCCETVMIDDIVGDLNDLVGHPITMAEEVTNIENPPADKFDESYTWTFYKLATVKGYVTVKWYGSSNGFYSERVDFARVE